STTASAALSIQLDGNGTFAWTASIDMGAGGGNWLRLGKTSGIGSSTVSVTVDATVLAVGSYNGRITLHSPQATTGDAVVPVTLTVPPGPQTQLVLTLETAPDGTGAIIGPQELVSGNSLRAFAI